MQIVSYVADENGYKADVRYDEDKTVGNTIEQPKTYEHNKIYNEAKTETKPAVSHDYYNQYSDLSKEYYNDDYSLEYPTKNYKDYTPQRKFAVYDSSIANKNSQIGTIYVPNQVSTVKPSYNELKPIFVTRKPYLASSNQDFLYSKVPVELSVPSTTPDPLAYDYSTTERVVHIGGSKSLYTNIRSSLSPLSATVTPAPLYDSVTPNFILSSTFRPSVVKNVDFSNNKATLSSSFIDRINKYLTYK